MRLERSGEARRVVAPSIAKRVHVKIGDAGAELRREMRAFAVGKTDKQRRQFECRPVCEHDPRIAQRAVPPTGKQFGRRVTQGRGARNRRRERGRAEADLQREVRRGEARRHLRPFMNVATLAG